MQPRRGTVPLILPISDEYFQNIFTNLPSIPDSTGTGSWFLRLIHFPVNRPEIVWDTEFAGGAARITQTKFSQSASEAMKSSTGAVALEMGQVELSQNEGLLQEVSNGLCLQCETVMSDESNVDFYFLYYCSGSQIHKSFAQNILSMDTPEAEPWHRLINRVKGSALLIPRKR